MRTAFTYRPADSPGSINAAVGDTIVMEETREYAIEFAFALGKDEQLRFTEIGGRLLQPGFGLLSFRNFVGLTKIAGVRVQVVSQKLKYTSVSQLLLEVSSMASGLIFSWKTPVAFEAGISP